MPSPFARPPFFTRAAAIALCAAALSVSAPEPLRAQGLFDVLNSIIRGIAPRAHRPEPPRLLEGFPGEDEYPDAPGGGPYAAYCVRTCDGRFFPLPASHGRDASPAGLCSAMCPAAETKIYSGTSIDNAVANDGKRYREMKNAFRYRDALVSDCSCNGRDTAGVAALDAKHDPTLQPGDIVVTAQGPEVFTGRRSGEFVPAAEARGLPKSMRDQLSDMRIAPKRLTATVKSGAPPAETVGAPAKPALTMAPEGGDAENGGPARQN